jgi:hypothetical protein
MDELYSGTAATTNAVQFVAVDDMRSGQWQQWQQQQQQQLQLW